MPETKTLFPEREKRKNLPTKKGESWAKVPGFPGYWVSDKGRVYSEACGNSAGTIMSASGQGDGYPQISLHSDGEECKKLVHRLVQRVHGGPQPSAKANKVNHINGDKSDARVENLEWVTPLENNLHGLIREYIDRHGLSALLEKIYDWVQ